jgi:hypothetical protein
MICGEKSWNIKVFGLLGDVNRNLKKSCGAKNTLRKISEGLGAREHLPAVPTVLFVFV